VCELHIVYPLPGRAYRAQSLSRPAKFAVDRWLCVCVRDRVPGPDSRPPVHGAARLRTHCDTPRLPRRTAGLPCQVSAVGEPFIKESRRRRRRQWRWLYNNETRRPRSRGEIGAASSAAEEPCAASPGIANEVLAHRGGGAPTRIEGVAGDRVGGRASEAPRGPRCTAASLLQPHPSRSSGGGSALDTGTSRVASRRRSRTPRSVGPRARTCAHGCALRMASKGLVLPSPRYAYLPCPLHEPGKSSPLSPPPPSPASVACLRRLPPSLR
jgi:hypothetical protein